MNSKEKLSIGELKTHIMYIRESIDDIKKITSNHQSDINKTKTEIAKIKFLGSLSLVSITIVAIIANIIF